MKLPSIHGKLLTWFTEHGRHNLPWQISKSPYTVWISEIMLQQTQVQTVIPYYLNFIQRFPDILTLANSSLDDVLSHWSGLGYYSRARNLHKSAQIIINHHQGVFPETFAEVIQLPGVGQSTAAAILSLALNKPYAILDGNVKRVLCRYHGIKAYPEEKLIKEKLWDLASFHMSQENPAHYSQAIMDLGALICTKSKPSCLECPLRKDCIAYKHAETHLIPLPKPKKAIPQKYVYFAVIRNHKNSILLVKRPERGIWGGLWSFIEAESEQELTTELETLGINANLEKSLPKFQHVFTHFKLAIHPLLFKLNRNFPFDKQKQIWYTGKNTSKIGLAKPVSKILSHILEPA